MPLRDVLAVESLKDAIRAKAANAFAAMLCDARRRPFFENADSLVRREIIKKGLGESRIQNAPTPT